MFTLARDFEFTTPVEITKPDGTVEKIDARFLYLDNDAFEKLDAGDVALVRTVWKGWLGIAVANGANTIELPFTDENRELLLKHPYVVRAVAVHYVNARAGLRAKN